MAPIGHSRGVAISEAARHDLYTGLNELLGPERTETLMSALPVHDLDEVATKGDLAELRAEHPHLPVPKHPVGSVADEGGLSHEATAAIAGR